MRQCQAQSSLGPAPGQAIPPRTLLQHLLTFLSTPTGLGKQLPLGWGFQDGVKAWQGVEGASSRFLSLGGPGLLPSLLLTPRPHLPAH